MSSANPSWPRTGQRESAWASVLTLAAAAFMIIGGIWNALTALVHDEVYVNAPQYSYSFDVTVWGWVHLLVGILVASAGFAILKGQASARMVGIAITAGSMIINFCSSPTTRSGHWPSLWPRSESSGPLTTYRRDAL
jgi:hypothetical protein